MVFIDTREKTEKIGHITGYFNKAGIKYARTKLYVGDYQRADNGLLLIDRKQDLLELAGNVSQGHARFKGELLRLDELGAKMYILVEEKLDSLKDVAGWESPKKRDGTPYTKLEGQTLYKILESLRFKHNIEFVFCHKNSTGKTICELLGVR